MGVYDFTAKDNQKKEIKLSDYRGKVLLIVNTATGCGLTPQYKGLEALYEHYKERGFEILDFPCNQFLGQAPGSDEEIDGFCQLNYGTTFKRFAKIDVNGKNADPLFVYLKEHSPDELEDENAAAFKKVLLDLAQTFAGKSIKWNFTKFLINRQGEVVARFSPTYSPEEIQMHIEKYL